LEVCISAISIGCDGGGPETKIVANLKVQLFKELERHVTSTYCDAIDEFSLVLRVDGSLQKFGAEGFFRLRFAKAKRYITLDIQMPAEIWLPMNTYELKTYLANKVFEGIKLCVDRLDKDGNSTNSAELFSQIRRALDVYLSP